MGRYVMGGYVIIRSFGSISCRLSFRVYPDHLSIVY